MKQQQMRTPGRQFHLARRRDEDADAHNVKVDPLALLSREQLFSPHIPISRSVEGELKRP